MKLLEQVNFLIHHDRGHGFIYTIAQQKLLYQDKMVSECCAGLD